MKGVDLALHEDVISRRIAKPAQKFFLSLLSSGDVGLPPPLRFPLCHRLMDFRSPASSASPATGDLAVDRFDRSAAFLRSAGTTAARAAGSLAGAPRVGGVDKTGGELLWGSLCCSFGSAVNVNSGGVIWG